MDPIGWFAVIGIPLVIGMFHALGLSWRLSAFLVLVALVITLVGAAVLVVASGNPSPLS